MRLLSLRITTSLRQIPSFPFSEGGRPYWSQANNIFKDYYSRRLNLQPRELQSFLIRLSQHTFPETDHRWISLVQNIEGKLTHYNNYSKAYMMKALIMIDNKTELFEKLYSSLEADINNLTFEESGVLLWCISKTEKKSKIQVIQRIYQHFLEMMMGTNKGKQSETPKLIVTVQENPDADQSAIVVKPLIISMVLSAIAHLKITEKMFLKMLVKEGIIKHITEFSTTGLVTILISFQKLGMRNKRDTILVYHHLRTKLEQLQAESTETLQNLAYCVGSLCLREPSQAQTERLQKYEDEQQRQQALLKDMRLFLMWICETLLLREKNIRKQTAAKMLFYASKAQAFNLSVWQKAATILTNKIQDCKIVDLVMALKALSFLPQEQRKLLAKEQETIAQRLWVLQSSLAGKSLDLLVNLFKDKKIRPPPKISANFNAILMEQQNQKTNKNDKNERPEQRGRKRFTKGREQKEDQERGKEGRRVDFL